MNRTARERLRRAWTGLRDTKHALEPVFRFIGRRLRGFYSSVLAVLLLGATIAGAAVVGFVALSGQVLEGETLALDEWVLRWFFEHRTLWLDRAALEISALGNAGTLVVLVAAVSVFLWETGHRYSVELLILALASGAIVNQILKMIFDRPRPAVVPWEAEVATASFPSGHAMAAMVVYGTVAYLVGRLGPTRRVRWSTWAFALLLVLSIGLSRVYLGVHYPSDVVAGYIAGVAWTAFVATGMAAIRYFAERRPGGAAEAA